MKRKATVPGTPMDARVRVCLDLPVPPSANRIWRVGHGRTYANPEYRLWLKKVRLMVRSQYRGAPLAGDVDVRIIWFRSARRGDVDNKVKPMLDALKGLVYHDDRQVALVAIERVDITKDAMQVCVEAA